MKANVPFATEQSTNKFQNIKYVALQIQDDSFFGFIIASSEILNLQEKLTLISVYNFCYLCYTLKTGNTEDNTTRK